MNVGLLFIYLFIMNECITIYLFYFTSMSQKKTKKKQRGNILLSKIP